MRLVLREYLSMLKESGELDALLPDLLVAMGLDPLSRPERGVRQFGVDLPAVGVDPEDGQRKLFLFLVKQGDITRSNWDTGAQAVRPSLNEIFDTYLRTLVRPEHQDLPKTYTEEGEAHQSFFQEGQAVIQMLSNLIQNNPSASSPCFDEHAVDIGLGLLALTAFGAREQAVAWLLQLSQRVLMTYQLGQHFPIASDSYDDLIALQFGEDSLKEQLQELSTLVPLLADWFAVLDLPEEYRGFREAVTKVLPKTDLQMWFPDKGTEEILYTGNASSGGKVLSSIELPETPDGLKGRMARLLEKSTFGKLSCVEQGWPVLGLIASRHFRTPLMPEYWQQWVCTPSAPTAPESGSESQ